MAIQFKNLSVGTVAVNAKNTGTQLVSSPDVLVEKIYFNTELGIEEVKRILSQLTYVPAEGEVYFVFFNLDAEKMIGISKNANDYMILDGDGLAIFATTDFMGMGISFTGWNPDLPNPLIINVTGITEFSGISIGQDNNKLTSLISMNNDFESGNITLSGEYDGSAITINESVNLQNYIDDGKLPMRINVVIPDYISPVEKLVGKIIKITGQMAWVDDSGSVSWDFTANPVLLKFGSLQLIELLSVTGTNSDYSYEKITPTRFEYLVNGILESTETTNAATFMSMGGNHLQFPQGWLRWSYLVNNEGDRIAIDRAFVESAGYTLQGQITSSLITEEEWNAEYATKGLS